MHVYLMFVYKCMYVHKSIALVHDRNKHMHARVHTLSHTHTHMHALLSWPQLFYNQHLFFAFQENNFKFMLYNF